MIVNTIKEDYLSLMDINTDIRSVINDIRFKRFHDESLTRTMTLISINPIKTEAGTYQPEFTFEDTLSNLTHRYNLLGFLALSRIQN